MKSIPKEELERNKYIEHWKNIVNDETDMLLGFSKEDKSNKVKYDNVMDYILTDDQEHIKKIIAFYYVYDKNFYNYAMDKFEKSQEHKKKPKCYLIGENGNIFNIMGIAGRTLKENSLKEEATEMKNRILESRNYNQALNIISEYVDIDSKLEAEEELDY